MEQVIIIELLILYSGILTIKYLNLKKQNKINYSNFQNALRVITDSDPRLAKYLEGRNEKDNK